MYLFIFFNYSTYSNDEKLAVYQRINFQYLPYYTTTNYIDICTQAPAATVSDKFLNVNQHILSIGKDGKLLVQDIRNGYYPRQHIFTNIVALSSSGDLAVHRGHVNKTDILGVCSYNSINTFIIIIYYYYLLYINIYYILISIFITILII